MSAANIRAAFNKGQYYQKAQRGELTITTLRESHVRRPVPGDPPCTMSQALIYRDSAGQFVALVHQYLRPDGTLGASGQPDPKRLKVEDVMLAVKQAR